MEGRTIIYSETISRMDHWARETNEDHASRNDRRCVSGRITRTAQRTTDVTREGNCTHAGTESSGDDADIMDSKRRLTERDICVVASQLGESWRVLGLRLNFKPETLDAIARSTCMTITNNIHGKMSENMLRVWSKLTTATAGRLAVVLWEMGHHAIAVQLQP
ncbi:uncharacterized protein LOC111868964 isoform X2 [Cryptotermes secundus]|uniref:uncharacterized protein LOC111868964 isoform X2 n=1 Tax=Cryptotermes secundus TaxID=105785 RepID=UPI000CD7D6DA|nr:uncharacterized protein LOC111868964 isoform X2 [Cryptotermes secundus]